jgi:Carboxypeptidase regulatory-like domain
MTRKLRLLGLVLTPLLFVHFLIVPLQASAQSQAGTLTGNVEDPTGAVIPGASITLKGNGRVLQSVSGPDGHYAFRNLAPGQYSVAVTEKGFAPLSIPSVAIAAGRAKTMKLTMQIAVQHQQVQVSAAAGPTISTAPSSNTNAMVVSGKSLNTLSNNPTELANELQALAGPAAGPNGGQIFINGFTGGQLPPKSSIERIVVNQNPFSAQYDRLGYGRIQIITKPGTNSFHGQVFVMGQDSSFNTLNPFTGAIPSYHSYMLNGTVSGPVSKHASFFFSAQQRNNQNDNIYTAVTGVLDPTTNTYVQGTLTGGLFSPGTYTNISPRINLQLGQNNTLSLRYQFFRNNSSGNLGAFSSAFGGSLSGGSTSLPAQAYSSDRINHSVQFDDTQIVNDNLVNETRLEWRHEIDSQTPASTAPSFGVPSEFSDGGNGSQHLSEHADHYELQNISTLTAGRHTITFGIWLRDNREALSADAGFNGSFNFQSLGSYLDTVNGLAQGKTVAEIAAACPSGQVCTPIKLTYITGPESFQGNDFDGALYAQDDWKLKPYLTLSAGLRFEAQNHVADHADWAPRFAFSYALGHRNSAIQKTVLRGGFGFFYDRFGIDDLMNLERYNGGLNTQKQTVIDNPTCFSSTSLSDIPGGVASCGTGSAVAPQIYAITPHYRSPYTEMLGLSLERQVTKGTTLTFTYLHAYGVHQLVTRNSNAYEPVPGTVFYNSTTGPRPNPALGIVDQYYPEGIFKENQVIVNFRTQLGRKMSLSGFWNYSHADTDGGGGGHPSNSYDLMQDYGRAGWIHPQWFLLMGEFDGPWGVVFNPFMIAQAGQPYNITTSTDLTGDNFFNNRPAYANASECPSSSSNYVQTMLGCLNTDPQPGATLIPNNLGNSPAAVAFNLRVSRSIGFGPAEESGTGGPPPPGGGHHHFNPGGLFGGGGGGGFGGPPGTNRKYTLTFSAHILNLFNDINYGVPSGSLIPTLDSSTGLYVPDSRFAQSTSLEGGIFSQGAAARRIYLHANFEF